jgi:hypothetical protein
MCSCHVPDRRWRYGVEKDSFATLIGHWRTGHNWGPREVGVICEDFTKKNTEADQVIMHRPGKEGDQRNFPRPQPVRQA